MTQIIARPIMRVRSMMHGGTNMKCITIEGTSGKGETVRKVVRCTDEVAHQLVADNRAEYAPKSAWKETGRKYLKGVQP
jgi:hypothetical protein